MNINNALAPPLTLPPPPHPSQETTLYGCTVRINEPVGVIGIACPDESPLLAFVSLFAPAVVRGNTIIIIPSEKYPLSATDLYQVSEGGVWRVSWGGMYRNREIPIVDDLWHYLHCNCIPAFSRRSLSPPPVLSVPTSSKRYSTHQTSLEGWSIL